MFAFMNNLPLFFSVPPSVNHCLMARYFLFGTTSQAPAYLPASLPACLPACLSACLPACLYACLPVCLPVLWHKFRLIHFVPWIKYEQIVFHCHVLDRGLCSQSQCWGWQHWKLTIADGKNEKKWLWLGVVSWWNNLIPR